MTRKWTPEERRRQAQIIRQTKPWQHSTGPGSKRGKKISAQNAYKNGNFSKEFKRLRSLLMLQSRYLELIRQTIRNGHKNDLF